MVKNSINKEELILRFDSIDESLKQIVKKKESRWAIIAVIISFVALLAVSTPQSPQVLFSIDTTSENDYCPESIHIYDIPFEIRFTNYGEVPTRLSYNVEGLNINVYDGWENDAKAYPNGLKHNVMIPPYKSEKSYVKQHRIKILDRTIETASLKITYKYKPYFLSIIPVKIYYLTKSVCNCNYLLNESASPVTYNLVR